MVIANFAFAETSALSHESELAAVKVGGNTRSESYSAKQKTTYKMETHSFVGSARYLQTKTAGVETAKQWEASLRYEKELGNNWGAFVQQGAEADFYSGYVQRDNSDIGGKYFFIKEDKMNVFSELGYRHSKTNSSRVDGDISYTNSGRAYVEYSQQLNESVSAKLWVEYLPNFKEADAYLVNYEPSVSVMMNQIFSLKLAYLVKFHNKTASENESKEDTTFTTALVAKF